MLQIYKCNKAVKFVRNQNIYYSNRRFECCCFAGKATPSTGSLNDTSRVELMQGFIGSMLDALRYDNIKNTSQTTLVIFGSDFSFSSYNLKGMEQM